MICDALWGPIELDAWAQQLVAHPSVGKETLRLRRLKHLGLVSAEFPSAAYTKWEHHLGIFHLSTFVEINAKNRRLLTLMSLLEGIGHLPYGYPVERAVLESACKSDGLRRELLDFLDPVRRMVVKYRGREEGVQRIENIVLSVRYKEIYRWFTAAKIMGLPVELDLGHRERIIHEIVMGSKVRRVFGLLRRLDYLHRDLLYTGLATFRLSTTSVESLVASSPESAHDVLQSLRAYLDERVYLKPTTVGREHVLANIVREELLEGGISLKKLLNATDETFENDLAALGVDILNLGSTTFDSVASGAIPNKMIQSEEASLPTYTSTFRSGIPASDTLLLTTKINWNDAICFEILVRSQARPSVPALAKAIARLSDLTANAEIWETPLEYMRYGKDLIKWLFGTGTSVNVEYMKMVIRLALVVRQLSPEDLGTFMQVMTQSLDDQHPVSRLRFALWQVRDLSALSIDDFVDCFKDILCRPDLRARLQEVRQLLGKAILNAQFGPRYQEPDKVELLAYLYEVLSGSLSAPKWVLPNTILIRDDKPLEFDVVALQAADSSLDVRVVECTKSVSFSKNKGDAQKLLGLSRRLQDRDVNLKAVTVGNAPGAKPPSALLNSIISGPAELPPLDAL